MFGRAFASELIYMVAKNIPDALPKAKRKWRPSLSMIVLGVLLFTLAVSTLPLVGMVIYLSHDHKHFSANSKHIEIHSALLAALMQEKWSQMSAPERSQTHLLGRSMQNILERSVEQNKAGEPEVAFYILDRTGTVIAARANKSPARLANINNAVNIGTSIAARAEVQRALAGHYQSIIRDVPIEHGYVLQRWFRFLSPSTRQRIISARPVKALDQKIIGVIYSSHRPQSLVQSMALPFAPFILAFCFILAATMVIAFIFARAITGPIHELAARTKLIGRGERAAIAPLRQHGSREMEMLSQSFLHMADQLFQRTDYISNFARHVSHELKTPLTSMSGAVELMQENLDTMSEAQKQAFLKNIGEDTQRLSLLLERLHDLARADNSFQPGQISLAELGPKLRARFPEAEIVWSGNVDAVFALSEENSLIVFANLVENATHHGADKIDITVAQRDKAEEKGAPDALPTGFVIISLQDNGRGITPGNAAKIFELFFTTRREEGGTGMGLAIVQSVLSAHKGSIRLVPVAQGARFELCLPFAGANA